MGDGATVLDPVAKENKSLLDHSLPVLRSGCSVMRSPQFPRLVICHPPCVSKEIRLCHWRAPIILARSCGELSGLTV